MNYATLTRSVDTAKALSLLELEGKPNGAYYKFPCPKCKKEAVIRAYGEKKNVWFCPECKAKGHIVSLAMSQRGIEWQEASKFLEDKAVKLARRKIEKELKVTLDLEYHKKLEEEGISEDTAALFEIGKPKGKGIMAGHTAFAVFDGEGKKVAYFGIHIENGNTKVPSNFNPELYLYRWNHTDTENAVFFTPDMFECVRTVAGGKQSVCNFGLPYLSEAQLELLARCSMVIFSPKISRDIMNQAASRLEIPLTFLKKITKAPWLS